MITSTGRSAVGISFHPKPTSPVTIPCPVTARGQVIGELIAYDFKTGRGTAEIDNNTSAALLPFLEVSGYTYISLALEPDANQRNAVPDYRAVDHILSKMSTDMDCEEAVQFVLKGMGNPPEGGKRDGIISHVHQWHVMHNSP
jgi:hypothetical protein